MDEPTTHRPESSPREKPIPDTRMSLWTEGVVLASIPFAGYLLAFSYEWGYLSHFSVPADVIELSTPSVIAGCVSLVSAIFMFGILTETILAILPIPGEHSPYRMPVVRTVLAALLVLAAVWLGAPFVISVSLVVLVAIVAFFEFIFPLFTRRRVEGYVNKLKAQEEFEQSFQKGLLLTKLAAFVPAELRWIALTGMLGLFLAFLTGTGAAARRIEFHVNQADPDEVAVRTYHSRVVCCRLKNGALIDRNFTVRQVPNECSFVLRTIGPLKLGPIMPSQ
jgi:hypothetical protein